MGQLNRCLRNRKPCIISSVVFLCFGYFILAFTFRKNDTQETVSRSLMNPQLLLRTDYHFEKRRLTRELELLKTFNSTCQHRDINVFVIEQAVLQNLLSANESETPCTLCSVGDVITLGVFGSDWERRGPLGQQLNDLGIVLNEVTSPDPRLLSLKRLRVPSIPTHYVIQQSGSIPLHLVVFYKRDDYWWHSSIDKMSATNSPNLKELHLAFGKSAGAYDRFDVVLAVADGLWLQLPHPVEDFLAQMRKAKFIECDYQGAQAYLRANPQKSNSVTQNWAQVLLQAKRALDGIGVPFQICFGTLLGWYRQCSFIPYTNDIDIEIPIQNYSPNILPAFLEAGFKIFQVKGKISDSYQISIKAGPVRMDVYFVYEEETYWWVGKTDRFTGRKYKNILPKSGTCWTDFMGYRVRVPCPTLPYITANYGENWNTSVKQWGWNTSGKNIKPNGMWPKNELHTVVQVMP